MRPVVIIGGGISGLSTAYYLARTGIRATLIEREARLGGVIQTEIVEGCLLEAGPDSFLSVKPWAMDLIGELGLAGEVIGSNDHLRVTYVWKGGRLVPLPDGLMLMIPTRILPVLRTPLLSWPTKLRMGLEWFRRPKGTLGKDRSVAEFVADHYGVEAVDYLAEPLLAGVYGGDPDKLSVSSVLPRFIELESKYGSLTKGVLAERRRAAAQSKGAPLFRTLRRGLGQLVEALQKATIPRPEVLHAVAEAVERRAPGYRVRAQGEWLETEHVVLACPAYQAGALAGGVDPELAGLLDSIPYSSSMTVSLGFEKASFSHPLDGFGFLVPKRERRRLVACTWVGTKFSCRVPESMALLRCFLGGENHSLLDEPDQTVIASLRGELRKMMAVTATPVFARIARWPRSMAQYTVGHQKRVARIEARLRQTPGLFLAGNAYQGIGVPDCVRMGKQAAERITARQ